MLDRTVNACSAVINLRTAIMRYRTPRNTHRYVMCMYVLLLLLVVVVVVFFGVSLCLSWLYCTPSYVLPSTYTYTPTHTYIHPRTPTHSFFRPEINARSTAYKRGIAYLERYCLLIAFQAYLAIDTTPGRHAKSFDEWYNARPDVKRALAAISQNPTVALAPMPAAEHVGWIMHAPETPVNTNEERCVVFWGGCV